VNWRAALLSGVLAAGLTLSLAPWVAADPPPWAGVWRHQHHDNDGDDDDYPDRNRYVGHYDPCRSIRDRIDHDRSLIAQWEYTGRHQKVVRWAHQDISKARGDLYQCRSQARFDDAEDDDLGSETTVGYFRDDLAPYGDWVQVLVYGWAWRPHNVDPDWRPYTRGRWLNTDYGWTWVADEPWGWAPYHYGRWYSDARNGGWVWVPGRRWAPAWVDWRQGDDYVGWAPLPPEATWQPGVGIPTRTIIIEPRHYCFVETCIRTSRHRLATSRSSTTRRTSPITRS
jgi:hypothetical protein